MISKQPSLFLLSFRHFESTANFCACQTADAVLRGHKTQTGLKNFAITCLPGPKLTRSEIFVSVYLLK